MSIKTKLLITAICLTTIGKVSGQSSLMELSDCLDSLILDAIDSMAFPGAQVYVVYNDNVIYHKSHGFHTYEKIRKVENHHVYDLASLTKVTTGVLPLMELVAKGKVDLDEKLEKYLPEFRKGKVGELTLRSILAHQGGLEPYFVYYQDAFDKHGRLRKNTFAFQYTDDFPIKITDRLYLHKDYPEKMYKTIKKSKVKKDAQYRYSGLFFQLLPKILQPLIGDDFESYLYEKYYVPMGLFRLTYKPKKRFPLSEIVPTEIDDFFRYQLVHGTVHDEAAAMFNGISCNAGLFGNAEDVGLLFQMLMNKGIYKGDSILPREVVAEFTSYQYPENDNRRGLAFDKPLLSYDPDLAYIAASASPSSFGHSGFTGTFVWADPTYDFIIVFLSNRVYPSRDNRKLYSMNFRPKIHQAMYDYIEYNQTEK